MKIKIDPKSPKKKFQEESVSRRPSKLGGKYCKYIFFKSKNKHFFMEIDEFSGKTFWTNCDF